MEFGIDINKNILCCVNIYLYEKIIRISTLSIPDLLRAESSNVSKHYR